MVSLQRHLAATGLQTEFFQLVQTALYHADGLWGDATVDLYLKNLMPDHGYLIATGIEDAIQSVLDLTFSEDDLEWIRAHPMYARHHGSFFDSLRDFSFSGTIWAMPEGTPVFPLEPIIRVTAPLPQVGLIELLLTQGVSSASAVATNAARANLAAGNRSVLDFGTRRVPGHALAEAAARAAFIGGCAGTTHALAAMANDIPAVGLISDTLLAAYDDIGVACDALKDHFPEGCHLNLPAAAPLDAIDHFSKIGTYVRTVRIAHEDLGPLSREVRRRLDRHGMRHTKILGSGGVSPGAIQDLVQDDAPLDLFALGSSLVEGIAGSGPQLSYRMASLVRGTSPDPVTGQWSSHWPSVKQVLRYPDYDLVCSEVEATAASGLATPLLEPAVLFGERVRPRPTLTASRRHCKRSLEALPAELLTTRSPAPRSVVASETLQSLRARVLATPT